MDILTKKIKICYIASVDITIRFILFNHLKFLKQEGHNVSVVCSPGKWIKSIEEEGFEVKTIRFKRKIFTPVSDLTAFIRLFFYLRKEKFDIIHTHTLKPGLYGQIAARLAGVPVVFNTIHGFYFTDDSSTIRKNFFMILEKIIASYSDLIFSISQKIINTAIKEKICNSKKIVYLGDGVDLHKFNQLNFSQDFISKKKKELGIPLDKKIIGIVARLVEEKGYLDLFMAFKKLLREYPNLFLLAVGPKEPEKKDALNPEVAVEKYQINNSVAFLGERIDMPEIYSLIDIFVLPTHREGLGISILEASAMEKPVIVTNIGGCPEAVDDKKTGILVPLKNSEAIFKAVSYLLLNPDVCKNMGKLGREKISKQFDEKIIFARLKENYDNLIKKKLKG